MARLLSLGFALVWLAAAPGVIAAQVMVSEASAAPAQSSGAVLTLDEAERLALEANRQLLGAALEVSKAEDGLALARLKRRPVFGVNLQASQAITPIRFSFPQGAFGTFEGIGPVPGADTVYRSPRGPVAFMYATAAQPLSQLVRINLGVKAGELSLDLERARADAAAQEIIFNVRRLYYGLLQTDAGLRAADGAIEAAREFAREMQERAARRVVLPADAADAELTLAQAEQARLSLAHALATRKEQLNLLLARDVRTPFALEPAREPSLAPADLDAAIAQARAARPDVRQAKLRVEQADVDRRATLATRIPDVSLALTYISLFNVDFLPRNVAGVGLQLQWEPFDWGRRNREAAQKGRTVDQAKLALREAEDRVALDLLAAARAVEEASAQLRVASLGQTAATERLRVRTEQLKLNTALAAEALQAQAQLAEATAKQQQAIAAYWTARADFERARGDSPAATVARAAAPAAK